MNNKIFFIIFSIFAVAGLLIITNIVHELSHRQDYHNLAQDDYICALIIPNSFHYFKNNSKIGYYSFTPNKSIEKYQNKIKEIDKYTESKAIIIDFIILLIFIISLYFSIKGWSVKDVKK